MRGSGAGCHAATCPRTPPPRRAATTRPSIHPTHPAHPRAPPPQVWRLVTNFLFLGKLNFNFIIHIVWVVQHACPLETQTYGFEPADFLWMLITCAGICVAISPLTGFVFNGMPLIMAIIYVWSRNFSDQTVGGAGEMRGKLLLRTAREQL